MTRIKGLVPLNGDVFTDEALAGLVGQETTLTARPGDVTRPIGRATVVEATQEDGFLVLTVDTTPPEREPDHIIALLGHVVGVDEALDRYSLGGRVEAAEEVPLSIGYVIADAEGLPDGHRSFKNIRLRQIGPSSMPFDRDTTLRDIARMTLRRPEPK